MPYIEIDTNQEQTLQKKRMICQKTAEMITCLSNKKTERTMVNIMDRRTMYFGNSFEPCAKIHVDLFHQSADEEKAEYCKRISELIEQEAGIDQSRIYVVFADYESWGSGGVLRF
ncbi:MAG: tautomerase family protein [Solobacterium sp.]|nr:tautomerase family protein [Solobacterium sp.]